MSYFKLPDLLFPGMTLTKTISGLPQQIDDLDISDNINFIHDPCFFKESLSAVPATVRKLRMAHNDLGRLSGDTLAEGVRELKQLQMLDISNNNLGNQPTDKLVKFFSSFPNLTVVSVNDNEFGNKPGTELKKIFHALPQSVTTLYANKTFRGHSSLRDVEWFVAAVPSHITKFDMGNIGLVSSTPNGLENVFGKIHRDLLYLGLAGNHLGWNSKDVLARGISTLPPKLQTLDMSDNGFSKLSDDDLTEAFAPLPPSVSTVIMDNNFEGTAEEVSQRLLRILPATVTNIYVDGECFERKAHEELPDIAPTERNRFFATSPTRTSPLQEGAEVRQKPDAGDSDEFKPSHD